MGHTFLVVIMKKWLKSVYICGSYSKIRIWVSLFGPHCTSTLCSEKTPTHILPRDAL